MKNPNHLCPGCMNEWKNPKKPCPVCGFVAETYENPPRWLPLRCILNGKYLVGKVIGEGGFGITYLGWDLNLQVKVAIKEYFPVGLATREHGNGKHTVSALSGVRQENYRQGLEKFMTEAKNLSKFYNLQGIVAVKDFFFENATAYMVMEYIDGITLSTYLKKHGGQLSEQEVLQLCHPVMESLKIVHQAGIIHRDISPDNIMMTKDGKMKLIDFGAARFAGGDTDRSLTIILKHGYAPAEQYQSHGNQGPWTDVYAISATMYRMMTGKVLPSAMDRFHKDTLEEFSALGIKVSKKTAYAIIDKGLALRVADRYQTMDELIQGLYGIEKHGFATMRKIQKKQMIAAIAGVCLLGVAVGGIFAGKALMDRRAATAEQAVQSEATAQAADTDEKSSSSISDMFSEVLVNVSEEELAKLQEEAYENSKKLSAGAFHLVALREDGTAVGSGTNDYEEIDVQKWKGLTAITTGQSHTVAIKEDGTVLSTGDTSEGKCAVENWKGIVKTAVGGNYTLGLKEDGTVIAAGSNSYGQSDVYKWEGIVDIAAGYLHSLGLKEDGTVVAVGSNAGLQCEVGEWEDIAYIYAYGNISVGLKKDGTLVFAGAADALEDAKKWKQVISVTLGDGYIAGLLSNHTVVVAGTTEIVTQSKVNSWKDITAIAASEETLFGMKEDGSIVRTSYTYGTAAKEEFTNLEKVVAADGYILGLKTDGTVICYGVSGNDFGQEQVSEWSDIVDIAGCSEAILGLKSNGTVEVIGEGFYQDAKKWKNIKSVAVIDGIALGLQEDGTIVGTDNGKIDEDYSILKNVEAMTIHASEYLLWDCDIYTLRKDGTIFDSNNQKIDAESSAVSISRGSQHFAAALEDGTVIVRGSSGGAGNVYGWKNVTQVAVGAEHTIGLRLDGKVYASGSNSNGQCDVSDWSDVMYVAAGEYYTLGITWEGELLVAGKISGEF